MKPSLLALSLAIALGTATVAHATDTPVETTASAPATTNADDVTDHGTRNKPAPKVRELGAVSVTAALDQARNALSPDTGSSQYVIDQKAIAQLPLGAATPVNQVVLQAPGVVQDSYGGL
ncbi:MAG TPA: TonB-dependent receptor, partial [Rhodanobacter sp.]|nr:TonB-dependent receptor [Rhodanobacter sp.]